MSENVKTYIQEKGREIPVLTDEEMDELFENDIDGYKNTGPFPIRHYYWEDFPMINENDIPF